MGGYIGIDLKEVGRCGLIDSSNFIGKAWDYLVILRPKRIWEDNIRMDLEEIGINAGIWVDSAQDRNYYRSLVNAALNLCVP